MLFGNREPRSSVARRREAYRPAVKGLEPRQLLAGTILDLGGGGTSGLPVNPIIASKPYGIQMAGTVSNGGAGYSVSDVGDLTGSGYDDFIVGAPTVSRTGTTVSPIGANSPGGVYLILGSATANAATISTWLNIPTTPGTGNLSDPQPGDQRVGDLTQLGNSGAQSNPITGSPSYPFAGFKLQTLSEPASQLGASVSAAGIINGRRAFLIGAPGANDVNGQNPGTGRAYLIFGGPNLAKLASSNLTPIDLDSPNQNSGLNFITFVNNTINGQTGRAVAGIGDIFGGGTDNIAIGAPGATVNGNSAAGDTYIVPSSLLPVGNSVISLNTIGQGNVPGIQITGTTANDNSGFALAGLGDINGATTGTGTKITDFAIGAPNANGGTGAAYVIYGASNLTTQATTITTAGTALTQIPLAQVGSTTAPTITGFVAQGTAAGDMTGYSVASGGDFNGDGLNDVLIGSPGYTGSEGRVDVIYGAAFNAGQPTGVFALNAVSGGIETTTYTGANAGDMAGFSVGSTQAITTSPAQNPGNPILIGAPGFNLGAGTVYMLPANSVLGQSFSLTTATSNPNIFALQFVFTTPGSTSLPFFGASVSGYQPDTLSTASANTADGDNVPDLIIGAPGYGAPGQNGLNQRGLDGGVSILEGAFIAPLLAVPTPIAALTSTIQVDSHNGPPFVVSATTPNSVIIYVFSNATTTPTFNPVTSLNPATITVNGVAFPNATIAADPVDENNDGIPDAIITISPRSALNLLATTSTFTLTARTLANSPFGVQRYSSSTTIVVTGGAVPPGTGVGTGGAGAFSSPVGQIVPTSFLAPLGPDTYVPSLTTLSQLSDYKPIPARYAIKEFLPTNGFEARLYYYQYPNKKPVNQFGYNGGNGFQGHGTTQLGSKIFTKTAYPHGKTVDFKHKVPVVPVNLQHEQLAGPIAGVTREPANAKKATVKPVSAKAKK